MLRAFTLGKIFKMLVWLNVFCMVLTIHHQHFYVKHFFLMTCLGKEDETEFPLVFMLAMPQPVADKDISEILQLFKRGQLSKMRITI
jgi:hypothetical protein